MPLQGHRIIPQRIDREIGRPGSPAFKGGQGRAGAYRLEPTFIGAKPELTRPWLVTLIEA